jgi:transcriptional antiterminator RfaH
MPEPFFAVARVQSQREVYAAENLERAGFEIFLPRIETRCAIQPLFCGYVFVKVLDRWRAIESTFGVICLIKFGDAPARCPDAEIAALRSSANDRGIITLPPEPPAHVYRQGERVKVIAFGATFDAIHTGMSRRSRELVLMSVLGSVREIAVARHLVSPAP